MTSSQFIRKQSQSSATASSGAEPAKSKPSKQPPLGRELLAKISAVEGIVLDEEAREAFAEFDRKGLSADERRRAIIARFRREPAE